MKIPNLPKFYVQSGLFGFLSILGAILNYALYPLLARILDAQNFGDFAAITAISNQLLGILLGINITSLYLVKSQSENTARKRVEAIQTVLLYALFGATALMLLFSPMIRSALQVQSIEPFILLSLVLLGSIPATIWTGYLQGHKELVRVGFFNVGAALMKIVLSVILALRFGVNGAITGIVLSGFFGLVLLKLLPGISLPSIFAPLLRKARDNLTAIGEIKLYLIQCVLVVSVFSFLQNYDITLAKYLFSPEAAGRYSGVSILSNGLYYVSLLIIWIILPEISLKDNTVNKRVLKTGYRLILLLATMSLLFVYIFRESVTGLLLGEKFAGDGLLLLFAAAYQLSLVASTLLGFFLLVQRKYQSIVLASFIGVPTIIVPLFNASNPLNMIQLLLCSVLGGMLAFLVASKVSRKPLLSL